MTKAEFKKYIQSFNKRPGEYTDDEIYEIGVTHKSLLKVDKNWNELRKTLGVDKTADALRCWVKMKQKQLKNDVKYDDYLLSIASNEKNFLSASDIIDGMKVDDDTKSEAEKLLEIKQRQLYIQQTKTRDTLNAYRRAMRDDARVELFKDGLLEAIEKLEQLPKVEIKQDMQSSDVKEAILMLSDMHIGVDCNNFYNTYNEKVAVKRVSHLVDKTIKYCQENKVKRLTIINMGDMIHGIIHTNARIEAGLVVTEQIMTAAEIISQALNRLQESAPEIVYRSVVDNHSRAVANKHEAIEKENFNKIIDWFIEERLKDSKIKFAHDNLDDGLGIFSLFNGKTVIFAHGHQDSMNNAFQNFIGATGKFFHYALLSHYHAEKMKSYQGVKVFINGSIVGTEEYALSRRLFNKPAQKLLIVNGEDILDISIDLDV